MTEFTPLAALLGGAMIGLAAVLLLAATGRIAGISGIAVRLFPPLQDGEWAGRAAFIAGLVAAPTLVAIVTGGMPRPTITTGTGPLIVAGLLVGVGSILGNGCTSGHGICGLSRLSVRSAVAVGTFMATAMVTVFIARHIFGG